MEGIETIDAASSLDEQVIVFRLHDEYFGFAISLVNEITEVLPMSMVPKAPDFVTGVVNYHGRILAVLNLARFFNLPSHERGALSRIVVLVPEGYSVGLLVDSIKEITFVREEEEEEPNPMEGEEFKNKYIKRVVNIKDFLVNIIDVDKLITDLEDYFKEVDVEY